MALLKLDVNRPLNDVDNLKEQLAKTQTQLLVIQEMFDALFRSNVLAICQANTMGKVLNANKTFLRLFGYTSSDVKRGLYSKDLSLPGTESLTQYIYDSVKRYGESKPVEKTYIRKDRTTFVGLVATAALPDNNNEFMTFILDQTETQQLKDLNKAKDEFIALASHQLRSPSSVVKQYTGVLLSEITGPLNADQVQYLNIINNANNRNLNLVNDLLKTAQIDTKGYKLKITKVNLNKLLRDCINETSIILDSKQQALGFKQPKQPVIIAGDKLELAICFNNLIENASKYSKPGTAIRLQLVRGKKQIVINVSDQGVGIAEANLSKIFEKFVRIDNELSDTSSGSGLGLYWVRRIIDAHGGSVTIKSKLGEGTTFKVRLPYE